MYLYIYILNTPAHMYIVCTLSVKNVRDGGLFETDEDDGWEGAQYPKEGESWGTRYVLFIYGK